MAGPVVRYGEREIPHDALRLEAARTAAGLAEAGVRHSDRVALVLRNEPTFLSLSAACGLIGAVTAVCMPGRRPMAASVAPATSRDCSGIMASRITPLGSPVVPEV